MKDGHREEYYEVSDQRFLGAEGFGEKLQDEHECNRLKWLLDTVGDFMRNLTVNSRK
jgi:hypothetical protein